MLVFVKPNKQTEYFHLWQMKVSKNKKGELVKDWSQVSHDEIPKEPDDSRYQIAIARIQNAPSIAPISAYRVNQSPLKGHLPLKLPEVDLRAYKEAYNISVPEEIPIDFSEFWRRYRHPEDIKREQQREKDRLKAVKKGDISSIYEKIMQRKKQNQNG